MINLDSCKSVALQFIHTMKKTDGKQHNLTYNIQRNTMIGMGKMKHSRPHDDRHTHTNTEKEGEKVRAEREKQ